MRRMALIMCVLAGAALLGGCPKKATTIQPPTAGSQVGGSPSSTTGAGGASTSGSALGGDTLGSARADTSGTVEGTGALGRKVIYFDFDKSEIRPEFADIVKQAAQNLASRPAMKLKLEGNTDERGTREYNIGLGERRAQAVRRALMLQGASSNQISTVSFGAERPAVEGDDESAWEKNRRVELVFLP